MGYDLSALILIWTDGISSLCTCTYIYGLIGYDLCALVHIWTDDFVIFHYSAIVIRVLSKLINLHFVRLNSMGCLHYF